jgi:enoyl-CoA hydratase/carnithine racemase
LPPSVFHSILNKIPRCNLPTIALIRGYALGLGLEIAMACDFRIVARGAKIGLPESRLGTIPGAGGTTRLTHLVGPGRAKEWIMTGRMIDLEEARLAGLVNAVVPANELFARGKTLAE